MRHDQIVATDSYRTMRFPPEAIAAIAPTTSDERPGLFRSAPAVPDVPVGVGRLIVASYVAMVVAFAIGLGGDRDVNFALIIVSLFVVVYFTLPRILLGVAPETGVRPSLKRFMSEGMMTCTGWTGGKAALVQILIVPVCLTIAAIAMMVVTRMIG
jgi:hypothetical protein